MSDRYADYRCDYELWDCENGAFLYIGCNEQSKVFDTATLRSALTHAIDRDTLCTQYYRGFAHSATLPASPSSPYYNKSLASRYGYDPVKFIQTLKAEGKEGSTMILLVNSDDSLRLRVARAIAQNLTDCGLVVEIKALGGEEYLTALKGRQFDLYVGQTRLSANMDLSAFFSTYGTLSYGGVDDLTAYALCLESLANAGNYYTLHRTVMENGLLCPVLFGNYSIFVTRGILSGLNPARDNIFFYSLGKTLADAQS
jgi:peptide/nickel transport system substrate-binding protein